MNMILVRHGETDWNAERRLMGQRDVPLNAKGRWQAERLAERLGGAGVEAIYSSDLDRAVATARPVAGRGGLELRIEPRLRERHLGEFEGRPIADWDAAAGNPGGFFEAPDGGESRCQLVDRVGSFLKELLALERELDRVVLVTHGGTIGALLSLILDWEAERESTRLCRAFHVDNGSISEVQIKAGRWRILRVNLTCHLC